MLFTFRKAVSDKGHPKDVLLSAVQKNVRRGQVAKALYAAIELERFSELPQAKALVTNLVNRLRVILGEETGGSLTCPMLAAAFDREFRTFEANRAGDPEPVQSLRRAALINMVTMLAEAPKQRLISDIKAVYFTPAARAFALASDDRDLVALFPQIYHTDPAVVAERYPLLNDDDAATFRPIVDGMLSAFKNKSHHGFYWLSRLVDAVENKTPVGARRIDATSHAAAHPMWLAFELYRAYANRGARLWDATAPEPDVVCARRLNDMLDLCVDYYKHFGLKKAGAQASHRDWIIFVIWPMLYCVSNVDWAHNARHFTLVTPLQADAHYAAHIAAPAREIDDYALDQHTAQGRALKRGPDYFATVGAFTTNQDETLFFPNYRRLYEAFKQHQASDASAQQSKKRRKQ